MVHRGRGDINGLHLPNEIIWIGKESCAVFFGYLAAGLLIRVRNADQFHTVHDGVKPRVMLSQVAYADNRGFNEPVLFHKSRIVQKKGDGGKSEKGDVLNIS